LKMKNTTTSLLMTALLATAGFAVAQTPAAPATRAEVKSEVIRDTSKAGEKNLGEPPKPGTTTNTTRAEVKSEVVRPDASVPPKNLSEPPKVGTTTNTTRSEVKSGVDRTDRELSTGEKAAATTPSKGYAKRKAARDERRAMNKSKSSMKANDGSSTMTAPEAPANK
jgi:hypothetical protein